MSDEASFRPPIPPAIGRRGLPRGTRARAGPTAPRDGDEGWAGLKRIVTEVDWTLSFGAFLVYLIIVITYRFTGASVAIKVAVGGLILERGQRRFPYWLVWFLLVLVLAGWALAGRRG